MRIAVVGCGEQGAGVLLPCAMSLAKSTVTAVCDVQPARAQAAAERWRVPNWFADVETLLEAGVADALVLASTPQAHSELLRRALPLGVAVFVEKPPAASLNELQSLISVSNRHRSTIQVGLNLRYAPVIARLCSVLAGAQFGSPLLFSARYFASWPRGDRWSLGNPLRAFLLTHVIHLVDLALFLLGPVTRVDSRTRWDRDTGIIVVQIEMTSVSGTEIHLEATNAAPRFQIDMTVLGSLGAVARVSGLRRLETTGTSNRQESSGWEPGQFEHSSELAGYRGELQAFVDAAREQRAGTPSLEASVGVFEVLDSIERGAKVAAPIVEEELR